MSEEFNRNNNFFNPEGNSGNENRQGMPGTSFEQNKNENIYAGSPFGNVKNRQENVDSAAESARYEDRPERSDLYWYYNQINNKRENDPYEKPQYQFPQDQNGQNENREFNSQYAGNQYQVPRDQPMQYANVAGNDPFSDETYQVPRERPAQYVNSADSEPFVNDSFPFPHADETQFSNNAPDEFNGEDTYAFSQYPDTQSSGYFAENERYADAYSDSADNDMRFADRDGNVSNDDISHSLFHGFADQAAEHDETDVKSDENKSEIKASKKEKKSGSGMKAYVAIMTAAFVLVAAMLGFCIMKIYQLGGKEEEKSTPKITIADNTNAQRISATSYDNGTDLTALYNESSKSCVSIICKVTVSGGFFGQTYSGSSLGSGFVVDKSGYIVTNHHVIEDAEEIVVQFYDGEQIKAELIGSDETCDLAVLKIETSRTLYPVTFGNSDNVQIGEKVYAIGTPSNIKLEGTLTYGVISGINRKVSLSNKTMTLLQTDATLNPGNSGGPLFNMNGEVIGINTLKLSSEYEGIGFSIPSVGAVDVINELIEHGEVTDKSGLYAKGTAKLGIEGYTVTDSNLPKGVYVSTVNRKTAVYKEGLSAGDIITEFNGTTITSMDQLKELLSECSAGDTATMKYYRPDRRDDNKGEYFEITFKLDAQS